MSAEKVHDPDNRADARPLTNELDAGPLVVALAPEFRRCAVYVMFGLVLVSSVARWVNDLRPPENRPDLRFGLLVVAILAVWVVSVFRWRLRVDGRGISRRRLFAWHLYSWDEFASGRVRDGIDASTYEFPDRYPWDRKLSIGLIAEDERSAIREMIRGVWVCPPEPEVPAELSISFYFRKTARFGREGLTIGHRGKEVSYAWGDVRAVRIRRVERDRRDFSSLELELPDQVVTLRVINQHGRANRSWSGFRGEPNPEPAAITAVIQQYVPDDRILVTSLSEPPLSVSEWEDRLTLLEKKAKELVVLKRIFWGLGATLLIFCLWDTSRGWTNAAGLTVVCGVQFGLLWAVLRYFEKDYRETVEELESQMPGRRA
jgi:hypothetical protein